MWCQPRRKNMSKPYHKTRMQLSFRQLGFGERLKRYHCSNGSAFAAR